MGAVQSQATWWWRQLAHVLMTSRERKIFHWRLKHPLGVGSSSRWLYLPCQARPCNYCQNACNYLLCPGKIHLKVFLGADLYLQSNHVPLAYRTTQGALLLCAPQDTQTNGWCKEMCHNGSGDFAVLLLLMIAAAFHRRKFGHWKQHAFVIWTNVWLPSDERQKGDRRDHWIKILRTTCNNRLPLAAKSLIPLAIMLTLTILQEDKPYMIMLQGLYVIRWWLNVALDDRSGRWYHAARMTKSRTVIKPVSILNPQLLIFWSVH